MQYALSLLALSLAVNAQDAAEVQEINVVLSDIGANQAEYLSWIQEGHVPPSGVLGLYQEISTYTDDSYTTLYSELDQSAISTYVTGLPWYSSRILPALAVAETGGASASASETSGSAASVTSGSSASSESSGSETSSSSSASNSASSGSHSGSASSESHSGSASSESHSGSSSGSHSGSSSGSASGSASGSGSGSASQTSSNAAAGVHGFNVYAGENIAYALAPLLVLGAPLLL